MKIFFNHLAEYAAGTSQDIRATFSVTEPLTVTSEVRPYVTQDYDLIPGQVYAFDGSQRLQTLANDTSAKHIIDVKGLQKHLAIRIFDAVANQVMGHGMTPSAVKIALESAFLERVLGAVPAWSDSKKYTITDVGVSTGGAFAIPVGFDAKAHEFSFFLIKRGDGKWGLPGGYFNITDGEQPVQGFVREFTEEVRNDKNEPIAIPDASRVVPIATGVDTRRALRVQWHGHFLPLEETQSRALAEHAARCESEPDYAAKVKINTKGEVTSAKYLKESELIEFLKTAEFAHPHEKQTLEKFLNMLDQSKELRSSIASAAKPSGPSQAARYTA